jgi:hypothetical protein
VNILCGGKFIQILDDKRDKIQAWIKHRLENGSKEN